MKAMGSEDLCVWADGTWCYVEELETMTHMSDDFRIVPIDSPEYEQILA